MPRRRAARANARRPTIASAMTDRCEMAPRKVARTARPVGTPAEHLDTGDATSGSVPFRVASAERGASLVGWIRIEAHPLERVLQGSESLRELRRDQKHLVGLALGKTRRHLQVLIGEQLSARPAVADGLKHRSDRLDLTFGSQDGRLLSGLRCEDHRLPLALGNQDLGLFDPSALRIAARRSRSARLFSIACWIVSGGSIDFTSTRMTRMSHSRSGRRARFAAGH
jgi:hypothetical protein